MPNKCYVIVCYKQLVIHYNYTKKISFTANNSTVSDGKYPSTLMTTEKSEADWQTLLSCQPRYLCLDLCLKDTYTFRDIHILNEV